MRLIGRSRRSRPTGGRVRHRSRTPALTLSFGWRGERAQGSRFLRSFRRIRRWHTSSSMPLEAGVRRDPERRRPESGHLQALGLDARCGRYLALPARLVDAATEHVQEEVFVVLEGQATLRLGEPAEAVDLVRGSVVVVEPGTPIQVANRGDEDATVFIIGAPPDQVARTTFRTPSSAWGTRTDPSRSRCRPGRRHGLEGAARPHDESGSGAARVQPRECDATSGTAEAAPRVPRSR